MNDESLADLAYPGAGARMQGWYGALRRYLWAIVVGNLLWEFLHMPLYTIWSTGSWGEIVAGVRCTDGDV